MIGIDERLKMYKQEKEDLDWPSEPFITFQEWDADYQRQYAETHVTVDVVDALAEADLIIEQAEKEILMETENVTSEPAVVESAPAIEPVAVVVTEPVTVSKPKAVRKAAKKASTKRKAKAPKKAKKVVKKARAESKKDRFIALAKEFRGKPRKDVIAAAMKRLKMSAAHASTYYQSYA